MTLGEGQIQADHSLCPEGYTVKGASRASEWSSPELLVLPNFPVYRPHSKQSDGSLEKITHRNSELLGHFRAPSLKEPETRPGEMIKQCLFIHLLR